jgi:hypothetical protein
MQHISKYNINISIKEMEINHTQIATAACKEYLTREFPTAVNNRPMMSN